MSKKKDRQTAQKRYYDTKTLFVKYLKRYGIVMIVATVISMFFCYIMSQEVEGFTSVVAVFSTLTIVMASMLFGMMIYNKIDSRQDEKIDDENEHDPFRD